MVKGRMNNWRQWLQLFSCGLLVLAAFAPLPDTPDKILSLVGALGLLVFLVTDSPGGRRESARFMIAVAALVLLALWLSINPTVVIFGSIAIYLLWDVVREEQAEYMQEREHLP